MTSIYKTCKIGIVPNISHLQNFLFTLRNYLFGQTHVIQPSSKEQGKGHTTIGVYTFLSFFPIQSLHFIFFLQISQFTILIYRAPPILF